jgi:hypothetical protein
MITESREIRVSIWRIDNFKHIEFKDYRRSDPDRVLVKVVPRIPEGIDNNTGVRKESDFFDNRPIYPGLSAGRSKKIMDPSIRSIDCTGPDLALRALGEDYSIRMGVRTENPLFARSFYEPCYLLQPYRSLHNI